MYHKHRQVLLDLLDRILNVPIVFIEGDQRWRTGPPDHQTPLFEIQVYNPGLYHSFLTHGNLGLGEAYMHNHFRMSKGKLEDLLTILLAARLDKKLAGNFSFVLKILPFRIKGWWQGLRQNVRDHYDIGTDLFSAFLDESMTYSCGYVLQEDDTLEQLQINKFERICQKLQLKKDEKLLDIGCGFGGMLIYAARQYGVTGVGVTNSEDHFNTGNLKIKEAGLENQIRIELTDFTTVTGRYDKIVSIGMMEHLPRHQYKDYFAVIDRTLVDMGRGLIHCVGVNAPKNEHDYFIQKYIFPMTNQPKLSEISGYLEKHNLAILDVENIIRHYGYTADHWLRRFKKNRVQITGYTDTFKNMFEYYLICCIAAARASDAALYQTLFVKNHAADLPLRRV